MTLPPWVFEPNPPQSAVLKELVGSLYQRRSEGVILRRATASIGEWRPQIHWCEKNVEAWVRFNPQHKRADGYVFFDYRFWGLGFVRFQPHVVIENEAGELVDITPHEAADDHPFIRHIGSRDQFAAALEHGPLDLIIP